MQENTKTLPRKTKAVKPRMRQPHHMDVVGLLVGNYHLCLDSIIVQRLHQPVGSYSRPPRTLTCIH